MAFAKELARGLLHLLYPGVCPVCACSVPPGESLVCTTCRAALTEDRHSSCPRCGCTVGPFTLLDGGCSSCRETPLAFDQVVRMGSYEGLLREVILRMKRSGEDLAEHVADVWFQHAETRLREAQADVVMPVPLHWWRAWARGYNQSEVLARRLASGLGLSCPRRWLRRVRATPSQTHQTSAGRWENVRGAFQASAAPQLRGKTVLLVDDVMTTGSTCSEAAKALRKAGAGRVVAAVLARSPVPGTS